ncbi:hypothetical protein GCM10009765_52780 [Fodinicola feengrottensis]|uniref:DUF2334 domain-containing protein n=1 Tax=Fodinicola feengrottensis TaxID=435914 RepID=A0ABN2I167_9ACTN
MKGIVRKHRVAIGIVAMSAVALMVTTLTGANASATADRKTTPAAPSGQETTQSLPAPPRPAAVKPATANPIPKRSNQPRLAVHPAAFGAGKAQVATAAATAATTSGGAAPGASTTQKTLILYDSTGQWGWLGEAYAVNAANLVSHGSPYVMQPVSKYTAGQMAAYTGVIYIGSTYDEPVPLAFLDDVLSGSRPVLWMNDNIWQLTARAADFGTQYGWNWQQFDFATTPIVTYKGVALQRDPLAAPSGLLATTVLDPTKATVLATATRTDGSTLPWAIRGGNLTYIGEIPFSYVGSTDRYFAAADLVGQIANPAQVSRKRALVRIEDVSADDDPAQLRQVADYLFAQGVPFSVAVIPQYKDPNGYYNNGKAVNKSLLQVPALISALRYMQSKGGTIIMHGYTHQYSNVANPYDAVSADDFEFYRSHIDASNNVVYDGPVAGDSASWAQGRITSAKLNFLLAGLSQPTIFEPPHYAASAADYQAFQQTFGKRYDRGLYFGGYCPNGACGTGTPDYTKIYGQYFPYLVKDIYGSTVIPEDLGNIEPVPLNNHPARLPADILASAAGMSVVTDGVQSFFYHPYLGTSYLQQIVPGIKGMGYQFVSPATVLAG